MLLGGLDSSSVLQLPFWPPLYLSEFDQGFMDADFSVTQAMCDHE